MANIAILGAQWGDEGKGKLTDFLAEGSDIIARFQGGGNAGHTVIIGDQKYVLHLLPSGILRCGKQCVIGNGVVLAVEELFDEIDHLRLLGIEIGENLLISSRTHLIMPYHRMIESWSERTSSDKIGTTLRGIGPSYADKMTRHTGIRVADLLEFDLFRKKIEHNLDQKSHIIQQIGEPFDQNDLIEKYREHADRLAPHVIDTPEFFHDALRSGKSILMEGAQGALLDVDFGTYPYVTSSNTTIGSACTGLGIGPRAIDHVIGVTKAYVTRVGSGILPTEMPPDLDEKIRQIGGEFGATTARARRCGWLDLIALRYATQINGLTSLAVTKLDVLDDLDQIKVCVGYEHNGRSLKTFPASLSVLETVTPIYETLSGWKTETTEISDYPDLPQNCRNYVEFISDFLGVPISIISVGPKRSQTLILDRSIA